MGTLFLTKEARIYNGAKTASSINGAGKTGQLRVKENEIRTLPNHTQMSLKGIKYLNLRPETIKLPEENIGRTLNDIKHETGEDDPQFMSPSMSQALG